VERSATPPASCSDQVLTGRELLPKDRREQGQNAEQRNRGEHSGKRVVGSGALRLKHLQGPAVLYHSHQERRQPQDDHHHPELARADEAVITRALTLSCMYWKNL
jgi:hypothetical protein